MELCIILPRLKSCIFSNPGYKSTTARHSGFIAFRFNDFMMKKICSNNDFYNIRTKNLCLSVDHKRTYKWWSPMLVVYSREFVNMRSVNYAPRRTTGSFKLNINVRCKSGNWVSKLGNFAYCTSNKPKSDTRETLRNCVSKNLVWLKFSKHTVPNFWLFKN